MNRQNRRRLPKVQHQLRRRRNLLRLDLSVFASISTALVSEYLRSIFRRVTGI
jgi:hypothetical protein